MAEETGDNRAEREWLKILTKGHADTSLFRPLWRRLPSNPRCKECYKPFGGVGGLLGRIRGLQRSRKNPNLCHL
jgi:adenylate cyclase